MLCFHQWLVRGKPRNACKMRIFLVDFENVHSEGLAGVDALTEKDEVIIFHSTNADTITFEMMHKLMFSEAKLSYFKVRRGGRNALDFQMSSYLGYLISANTKEHLKGLEFYLISKDSGFDFVMDFWESGNVGVKPHIARFYSVKAVLGQNKTASVAESKPKTSPKEASKKKIELISASVESDVIEIVKPSKKSASAKKLEKLVVTTDEAEIPSIAIAETPSPAFEMDDETVAAVDELLSASKSSHELYIGAVKRFGQKKGVEIYRTIKSKFLTKKTG